MTTYKKKLLLGFAKVKVVAKLDCSLGKKLNIQWL